LRYAVNVTGPAEKDIQEAYGWLHAEFPEAAERWFEGIFEAIYGLESFPLRCSLAPESSDHQEQIRQLIYASHRILFAVRSQKVIILRPALLAESRSHRGHLPRVIECLGWTV
jgi:plasmid stabilization system protein ParE